MSDTATVDAAIKDIGDKIAGLTLIQAKSLVDGAPKTLLEAVSKEDAAKWKKELEAAGATVDVE